MRTRILAALVDTGLVLAGMAAFGAVVIGGVFGLTRLHRSQRAEGGLGPDNPDRESGDVIADRHPGHGARASASPPRSLRRRLSVLNVGVLGASAGLKVAARNWPSPGWQLQGLRRVDARTGGPVTVWSAVTSVCFDQAWQTGTKLVFGSRAERHRDRARALDPQLRAIQRELADDPEALSRATLQFYNANHVNALNGCGWLIAGTAVRIMVDILGAGEGRTLRDRVSGTTVVHDR